MSKVMGNSKSINSKVNSTVSFHSVFEEIYMKNTTEINVEASVNFEWVSVIESAPLLNRLYENDLRFTTKATASAQTAYAKYRSTKGSTKFHTPIENPAWSLDAKQAFVFINTLPTNSSNIIQNKLPVFFTATELKKIYRQRAKLTHPDLHGGSHTQFIDLKKNCQILMDFSKKID